MFKYITKYFLMVILLFLPSNEVGYNYEFITDIKILEDVDTAISRLNSKTINADEVKIKSTSKKETKSKDKDAIGTIIFENGSEVYIYDNPTDKHMILGAGKLINGSILNEYGNSILLSHRDTHFKVLKNIKKGDFITIKTRSSSKKYKVIKTYVTSDDDPKPYKSSDDIKITLITCYPFINSANADERFIVIANLFT